MGYRPNRLARSLKLQRTNVVGMLIPDITNPLFSALFRAIDEVAYATGYQVILCNTEDKATRLHQQLEVLSEGHVDGIVVTTAHRNDPTIEMLRQRRVPYVLVSRRRDNSEDWWIVPDDEQGAWLAVQHLAGLGHRRIAHIAGSTEVSRAADRLRGYNEAMESFGLESMIWSVPFGGLDETAGETGLVHLLDYSTEQRPTAIFAANDLAAVGVIAKARQFGLQIPRDLSVIGCDNTPMSGYMAPKLTTINYPFQDVARFAIDNLVKLILSQVGDNEAPVQVKLPVELITRESTASPSSN
jgi:LacI family transcriptional regulator